MSDENRIALIMAGGTGGHIYPALAVAKSLIAQGWTVSWLGSKGGLEETLIARESLPLYLLPVSGVRGKGFLTFLKAPYVILKSIVKSVSVIKKTNAKIMIGFGGFASGPGGAAAFLMRKKLIIHEQNACAGMTNRMLSKVANVVCEAFPLTFESQDKVKTIGNPLRQGVVELSKTLDIDFFVKPLNVLILGGSRGASIFNQQLPEILSELIKKNAIHVTHQTGSDADKDVESLYKKLDITSNQVAVCSFIHDIDRVYRNTQLLICRSGALTVSEVAALGIPAIFVPFPFAVDDHQTKNAESITQLNGGFLVLQSQLDSVKQIVDELVSNPQKLTELSAATKSSAKLGATEQMVQICESVLGLQTL